jgi:hypothetical protein
VLVRSLESPDKFCWQLVDVHQNTIAYAASPQRYGCYMKNWRQADGTNRRMYPAAGDAGITLTRAY